MKISRRTFIKGSAGVGAAVALTGPTLKVFASGQYEEPPKMVQEQWKPSTCQGCTTWCPVEVLVQDGRAVKVRGNRYSRQNDGYVCPKGHLALQQLYDPDRIKVPMKRTNPKKGKGIDPGFVPISWDEAMGTIADKMMELRKSKETNKFLLLRGRYTYLNEIMYSALPKVFGSPNGISHSAICAEAEKFGPYYTAGNWGYRDYDLDNSKYVLIWGCDPLSSNRMIPASIKRFGDVLDNATVAVVDPKINSSAAKGHEWLPVIPGEDGALASAIAHVILAEGLWNREFVGNFTNGNNAFIAGKDVEEDSFKETQTHGLVKWWNIELKDKTPQWAEKKCGISKEQIIRVAKGLGEAAPRAIVWLGPGAAMHVRGSYSAMAIHAINGLLGCIDAKGGVLAGTSVPTASLPGYGDYQDEISKVYSKKAKIDQRGYKNMPALKKGKSGGGVVTNNTANAILAEDPYEIKVAIAYWNNLAFSSTGAERWEKALAKIPFFAHITTNAAEMTQFADIVLPVKISQFERYGFLKSKANGYGAASLSLPVVEPLWDLKTDETEIPWMLAEKLRDRGFANLYNYLKNEFKDPETGDMPRNGMEFSEYFLKLMTAPLWDGKKDVGGDKINGWQAFKQFGMWNSDKYKYKARWGKFKTKTKMFEFYSETLKAALKGHAEKHKTDIDDILETCNYEARGEKAFVPHYEAPFRYGSFEEYPLTFIDFKSKLNREGRSQNTTWYHEFKKVDIGDSSWDDVLQLNPVDALKYGVKDGDSVRITSVVASINATIKISEGIQPGTAAKCFGQGHWAYGNVASDYKNMKPKGGSNNLLMPDAYDRLSGSTVRNGGFTGIKIEKL